jgi:hypothetical protein
LVIDHVDRGVEWHIELARSLLLPGRLVDGRVRIRPHGGLEARALVVTLSGLEHWRHRVTRTDAQGHVSTEVVTSRAEPIRVPVVAADSVRVGPGELLERSFQIPVPPLGPASLEADDAGQDWTLEAKLDIEGGLDSRVEQPIQLAQPTALLRAGVVPVGPFALYPAADASSDGITASLTLDPLPLVTGEPFRGQLELDVPGTRRLQEIRAELRVKVEATVSQGESEEITAWAGPVSPAIELSGSRSFTIDGVLPPRRLPTIELPHGRAAAAFHVILAIAWARDVHLVREVTLATTREL